MAISRLGKEQNGEWIKKPRRLRNYLVYDFEWIPHRMEIRCCGVYDGKRYRVYKTVRSFILNELTSKNRGRWFYSHYGGMADAQFVLKELILLGYTVKASFAGASAIIIHVTWGKNSWHLIDSFWLLKEKLAKVAKWIGMEKTGPAALEGSDSDSEEAVERWYATVSMPELIDYNRQDCVILWNAICEFENALLGFGGQLQMTLASSAMYLFRRNYLHSDIETSISISDTAIDSFFSSRVEVFNRECTKGRYYDINSSFPFAMTLPVPGNLICNLDGLPDAVLTHKHGNCYMADVSIKVPESYIPPVPYRMKKRVFFPYGKWRSWLTDIDIELMLQEGGKILKVHDVMVFEPFHDLTEYANDLYERKAAATDKMEREVYKVLLNSLYGKFAESRIKSTLYVNPSAKVMEKLRMHPEAMVDIVGGHTVWIDEIQVAVPHRHVPISATITARARKTIYEFLTMSRNFHYCDTDGFATNDLFLLEDKDGLPIQSTKIGELKAEPKCNNKEDDHVHVHDCYVIDGTFISPKVYRINDMVKAKGFSLGKDPKKAIERFVNLIEGKEIEVLRMRRLKENLRLGNIDPEETEVVKSLKSDTIGKRFMFPDGETRPWHITELEKIK
jgi:hypothetical protein